MSMSRTRMSRTTIRSAEHYDEQEQRVRQRIRNYLVRTAAENAIRQEQPPGVPSSDSVRVPLHEQDLEQNIERFDAVGTEGNCTVCMVDIAAGDRAIRLPCQHVYHDSCGTRWLRDYSHTCPVCRQSCGRSGTPRF
jgi:hypothetical protein